MFASLRALRRAPLGAREFATIARPLANSDELVAKLPVQLSQAFIQSVSNVPQPPASFTFPQAYALQNSAVKLVMKESFPSKPLVAGYKVGATAQKVQELFKVKEPFTGPILSWGLHKAPLNYQWTKLDVAVECEFAFRLKREFAAGYLNVKHEFNSTNVVDGIESLHLAVELVGSRWNGGMPGKLDLVIADFGCNIGLVIGKAILCRPPALRGLRTCPVHLSINGKPAATGKGSDVLGDPLNALAWFLNFHRKNKQTLPSHPLISTGTCTGATPVKKGDRVKAVFGDHGTVDVTF